MQSAAPANASPVTPMSWKSLPLAFCAAQPGEDCEHRQHVGDDLVLARLPRELDAFPQTARRLRSLTGADLGHGQARKRLR